MRNERCETCRFVKVWWLVVWDTYYPSGGLGNVKSTHASKAEAEAALAVLIERGSYDPGWSLNHAEIVDISDRLTEPTP